MASCKAGTDGELFLMYGGQAKAIRQKQLQNAQIKITLLRPQSFAQ